MQEKIIKKKVKEGLAISEIILLITSIIAFSYVLGNSFSVISAAQEMCIKSATTGEEFKVNDIMDINAWCEANGRSQVCTGGSKNWKLSIPLMYQCGAAPAATGPIESIVVPAFAGEAARKILDAAVPTMESGVFTPAAEAVAEETVKKTGKGWLGKLFGKIKSNPIKYAGIAVVAIATYTFISTLIKTGDPARALEAALRVGISAGIGAGAGYLIGVVVGPAGWLVSGGMILGALFSSWLKREQDREITFTCKPWQAQTGGSNCESCNNKDFPCTEYQCRSLGTGCELINKDTDEPRCIWKDPRDVNTPIIQPWEDALTEGYEYVPLPPIEGTGVEIKYIDSDDGCSPAFQPFTFGVELDKDGYCRIDDQRTADFSEMIYDFGGINLYIKNHTQLMTFPGAANWEQEGINLTNDGEFEFYVRCEAATNGRANRDEFIFKFCIDKGPDTTPPEIRRFDWIDGAPIAYFEENETKEVDVQVYVNEPAKCKWDHEDKSYENMENNLTCPDSLINFNAQLSYTCSGKLTGLKNSKENKFFFRCDDTFGNVNIQSKTLTLIGTQPLFISSVEPNATTIKNSTDEIKVTLEAETSAGYKQGEATCYYSNTGTSGSYVLFSNTNSPSHSEKVWLGPGDYNYFIRCFDLAGNSDIREISFTVETDTAWPIVVRIFRDGIDLKIITDEEASCVYDNRNCLYDFDDGIEMTSDGRIHTIKWDPDKNLYIKCQDEFENRPVHQSCSITVRPFEI